MQGSDAKALYEEGIRSILAKFDLSSKADAYLAQTKVQQQKKGGKFYDIDYVDILDAKNNLPGRLDICVAWNDADTDETKLEKIITQKWISIFPNGNEAWVDYRRTGYPRLFPSVQAWQGVPSFPVELQLRRIPYDESDENILFYDLPNIEKALSIYGEKGKNAGGQRLYFEGDPAEYPYVYDEVTGWFLPCNYDLYEFSSVEDNEFAKQEIKIYPQPMRDYLIISGCKEGDLITITDISGKVIYNNVSTSNRVTIDVADYPNGVYIVKVGNHVEKIVK